MKALSPSDLKAILHSKRANIYYLEKCRVMQKSGRVLKSSNVGQVESYIRINTSRLEP